MTGVQTCALPISIRDFLERLPDSALEGSTADSITIDVDRENRPPTGEVLFELCPDRGEEIVGAMPAVALGLRGTVTMVFHEDPSEPVLGSAEADGADRRIHFGEVCAFHFKEACEVSCKVCQRWMAA